MVSSHRPAGYAGGAALLPVYGWDVLSSYSAPRWETRKTSRGRREVGRRRYVGMRGNPDGFLSSPGRLRRRGCSPSGIRLGCSEQLLGATLGDLEDKSRPT